MKVFLSGTQTWHTYFNRGRSKYGPLREGVPMLKRSFPSYWYERGRRIQLRTQPADEVILDSGAHTFFSSVGLSVHGYKITRQDWGELDSYFRKFLIFLKRNWASYDYYVELDVADLFGIVKVEAMREDLRNAGLWSKCITAWHPVNGEDDYARMLDETESRYVALEGIRPGVPELPYNRFIKPAYDRGIKVHGFALMSDRILRKYPFYSVDCASWLLPVTYGKLPQFINGRIHQEDIRRVATAHKRLLKPAAKLEHSIKTYRKAEGYYTDYWIAKGIDWEAQIERHNN